MQILVTNDDGIASGGLKALCRWMGSLGSVTVAAPARSQTAVGHAITIARPINVRRVRLGTNMTGYSIEGTPADCVKLAFQVLLDRPPDLVVSGINDGANAGVNVFYSGTVAAAAEASLMGVSALAVSLERDGKPDFDTAGRITRHLIKQLLSDHLKPGRLINVNIPALSRGWPKGIKSVRQCMEAAPRDHYRRRSARKSRSSYYLAGELESAEASADCDVSALRAGHVTVTPILMDLTDLNVLSGLSMGTWQLPASDPAPG